MTLTHYAESVEGGFKVACAATGWAPATPVLARVTCPACLEIIHPGLGGLTLDLVPLADEWARLVDEELHAEAESLVYAAQVMTGKSYVFIFDLFADIRHRKHGTTVRFIHAPF